jgi:hypothetical protein
MFDNAAVQRRLLVALAAYEICVIGVTGWAGANIALSGGGSLAMAAPLLLIAAAESLRIFVAGWASRVSLFPKMLALLVLAAISVASFEGLSLAFEVFLTNRITHITDLQRDLRAAEQRVADASAKQTTTRDDVARIDAAIKDAVAQTPVQPSLSGKTCAGKRGATTCNSDVIAQRNYVAAVKAHNSEIAQLRAERARVQQAADIAAPTGKLANDVADARDRLNVELQQSPMHRLSATWFGVTVDQLTQAQFEAVRRVAIGGLAGSLAVLSMLVSLVAHAPAKSNEPSKLSRAIRAYIARRRKPVVRVVQVPSGVKTVVRYVPVPDKPETIKPKRQKRSGNAFRVYPELFSNADHTA